MITPEQINEIFDRIPEGRITPISATFAKDLLAYNQNELLKSKSLGNEPIALKDLNNYRLSLTFWTLIIMVRIPTHRSPTHPGEMLLAEFLEPMGLT
jgi:hypothetical protein